MSLSDNELIINAQNGDISSFEELVYRYDKMVLRIALKYTNDTDDAKDVYQEVFIKVFNGLKNFKFESSFSTWLFRVTSNVCLTYTEKNKKKKFVSINADEENEVYYLKDIDENSPDNKSLSGELGNKINKALGKLSPNQKMSFLLKHYEGYKIKEIAAVMNCTEGTIKKYLFEAVRKLRTQLEGYY